RGHKVVGSLHGARDRLAHREHRRCELSAEMPWVSVVDRCGVGGDLRYRDDVIVGLDPLTDFRQVKAHSASASKADRHVIARRSDHQLSTNARSVLGWL